VLFQKGPNQAFQAGQVVGEGRPHDAVVDIEVTMNHSVSHPCDLSPRHPVDLVGDVFEVLGRLANVGNYGLRRMSQDNVVLERVTTPRN